MVLTWTRSTSRRRNVPQGLAFYDDERDVVRGRSALCPFCERGFDAVADAGRRGVEVIRNYLIQPLRTKLFALWTESFRNSVGVDDQHVVVLKLSATLAIVCVRFDPEG